jgi:alpha-L-fucosidase
VYALITVLPDDGTFGIRDIAPGEDSKITMLGVEGELKWKKEDGGIAVELPRLNPSRLPCRHVYTLKITSAE